jgi:hypothetical protein
MSTPDWPGGSRAHGMPFEIMGQVLEVKTDTARRYARDGEFLWREAGQEPDPHFSALAAREARHSSLLRGDGKATRVPRIYVPGKTRGRSPRSSANYPSRR